MKPTWSGSLIGCLICLTGCFPTKYYRPSADGGEVVPHSHLYSGASLRFNQFAEETFVSVAATPEGSDTRVYFQVVTRTNNWIQLKSDMITLRDLEGNFLQQVQVREFDTLIKTKGKFVRSAHKALDRLEPPDYPFEYCNFLARLTIPNFKPETFAMVLPSLTVDGGNYEFPPITFESRVGVGNWTDGP